MSEIIEAVKALQACTFLPGSFDKRFARSMPTQEEYAGRMTEKQIACLWKLVWRYRRQIKDKSLVDLASERIRQPSSSSPASIPVSAPTEQKP